MDNHRLGASYLVVGASIWGLFWLPLRAVDETGVAGLWAVALVLSCAGLAAVPAWFKFGKIQKSDFKSIFVIGIGIGIALALYSAGVIISDVLRVIFLFYLLPVWATLLSWLIYRQTITKRQLLAIAIALMGLYLLLGGDGGLPLPRNLGDWFGLISGLCWAMCLVLLRQKNHIDPLANSAAPFIFGALIAVFLGVLISTFSPQLQAPFPDRAALMAALPIALFFGVFMVWPSMFAQIWGARHVPAPTAALLTMAEIIVATASAWYFGGTDLPASALAGGAIIVIAALVDLTANPTPT